LVIRYRTALGYSGLGLYSFCLGSAFSSTYGGLLLIVGMSIYQCIEEKITVLQLLGWLVLGLPIVAFLVTRAFQFLAFISKVILRLHVAVNTLPVGPGYKAFCFASMCVGILSVPDREPMANWGALGGLQPPEFASGLVGETWRAFEPWLKLGVALGFPLVFVL